MDKDDLEITTQIIVMILAIISWFWLFNKVSEQYTEQYIKENIHKYPQCATAKNVCRCIRLSEAIEYGNTI